MNFRLFVTLAILSSFALFIGCSAKSQIKPYIPKAELSDGLQNGIVFSLPHTILEAKITYSLYEKRTWEADAHGNPKKIDKDAKLLEPKSVARIVSVDKPIEISEKNIPDQNMQFVFDSESLNKFSKNTDITIELTKNGMLQSTNFVIQDKTKEIISNLTETVFNIAKIAAVAGEDVVELIHIKDVIVTRLIDPSSSSLDSAQEDNFFSLEYSDKEKAESLFDNLPIPDVSIILTSGSNLSALSNLKSSSIEDDDGNSKILNGIPYSVSGPVKVSVTVDDQEVYANFHMFAQAGGVAIVPLNSKSFTDVTQGLSFSEDGSSLTKFISKGTSRGEALSLVAKETSGSILTGIQSIDQVKLDKLKKEKEIIDAEEALKNKQELSDIQAKIDLLKKEKELIDAELALKEAQKKLQEAETSE